MSAAAELQKLILDRLIADATISAALGTNVFDAVPTAKAEVFPRITFGAYDFVPDDAECIYSGDHTQMIDVWSRDVGRVEAKNIVEAVRRSLRDYTADMDGYGLLEIRVDFADVITDPDGKTAHGRVQVTAMIEEPE